jgi:type IV fimbrial biogenesis protein FimT
MYRNGAKGFTLLELMVTLIVAAVLVVGVVPNLSSFVKRNRAASTANDLLAAIQYARSEALTRGTSVYLCRRPQTADSSAACTDSNLTTASHCSCVTTTTATTADGWEDGWLVVADSDRSDSVSAGDTLLQVQNALGGGFTVRGNANVSDQIGFRQDSTAAGSIGSLFICGPGTETASTSERIRHARKLVISRIGQTTVGSFTSGDISANRCAAS